LSLPEQAVDTRSVTEITMGGKAPKEAHTTVELYISTRDKLRVLKRQTGFRTYDSMLNHLAEVFRDAAPYATYELLFKDARPYLLTGPTGAGKSFFIRHEVLPNVGIGNLFIVDSSNEYPEIEEIGLGEIWGLKWDKQVDRRVRFVPSNESMIAKAQVESVLWRLDMVRNEESHPLKLWTCIFEEAHRLRDSERLHLILMEARKTGPKTIVISTYGKGYEGIPRLEPRPWQ